MAHQRRKFATAVNLIATPKLFWMEVFQPKLNLLQLHLLWLWSILFSKIDHLRKTLGFFLINISFKSFHSILLRGRKIRPVVPSLSETCQPLVSLTLFSLGVCDDHIPLYISVYHFYGKGSIWLKNLWQYYLDIFWAFDKGYFDISLLKNVRNLHFKKPGL